MSASAGSIAISARPLSSLSAVRQPSSTRCTSPMRTQRGLGGGPRLPEQRGEVGLGPDPARHRRRARRRRRRGCPRAALRPRSTASRPARAVARSRAGPGVPGPTGGRAQQRQPAYARPVPRLGLVGAAEHPQPHGRRGADRGAGGVRQHRRGRGAAPGGRTPAGAARARPPVGPGLLDPLSTANGSGWPARRTPRSQSCWWTAAPPSSAGSSTVSRRSGPRPTSPRCWAGADRRRARVA